MDRFNNINPADTGPAASEATVEQPQRQQAEFEQHLGEAGQAGPIYPHRELYNVSDEDDRLIQAASSAALERGPPPGSTTVSIYDRRLRKLAELLKQSGKSIAELNDDTLLAYAKKLLPTDKIIAPALFMVSRYRDPDAIATATHYRPSKEDERLIREAAEAGFGRAIDAKTAGNYASSLRKLAAALRPLSMAKISDEALLGHANALFRGDDILVCALNGLRNYRAIIGPNNLGGQAASSRLPTQPAAHSPLQVLEGQPFGNAADRSALAADGFNAPQDWHEMGLATYSPIQSVAQDMLFDAAERSGELTPSSFDASLLWQGTRDAASSPVQSFAQEELFDAAARESLLPAMPYDASASWPTMSSAGHSNPQSVDENELFHAVNREDAPAGTTFDAPELWPPPSSVVASPMQSFAQEDLFDAADREGSMTADRLVVPEFWREVGSPDHPPMQSVRGKEFSDVLPSQPSSRPQNPASEEYLAGMMDQGGAALATRSPPGSESFDTSWAVPDNFSHGNQSAPDMMLTKLGHWGLLPDAAERVKTYDIAGERYTAVLGPGGRNDVQLIHLRSPAAGDTFDVSFAVPKDFSHGTQLAPDMMLSTLGKWDFLPNAEHPIMNYEISGERYTAVLGPKGPDDVQLIHHPKFALPGDTALLAPTGVAHTYGALLPGFDPPASLELRKAAANPPTPSAAQASGHQPLRQVPEIGELFPRDWRHGPQEASPAVIDTLQNLGLLPSEYVPMTRFLIHGQPYTAESLPRGRVLLFHRPQFG
ncbi:MULTISPECIES: hypothetical protein [unclassified Bradyrhizobium]|uniref:hypothetical protein n=1 Tax=unclassified Bradyrhizobium TaxID=2631580 RepID=UPI00209ED0CE|nr:MULTISPECIES: hypothetical protein [unclassified Bradyrhizobium]MCP1838944.1 hypothetical protein [Bradyrhizobium sp. USDA 4538]MCP1899511.1 hypothetical protein [Bradyrhizobium sp. USDA 4537]MCP1986380.1 hypothetical protein [Bradyrhizobium sp. USDA 4539]